MPHRVPGILVGGRAVRGELGRGFRGPVPHVHRETRPEQAVRHPPAHRPGAQHRYPRPRPGRSGRAHVVIPSVVVVAETVVLIFNPHRRTKQGSPPARGRYLTVLVSIWSKSPMPLVIPPPPDHCHITACFEDRLTPPKNRAQVVVRRMHHLTGAGDSLLVPLV